MTRRLSLAAAVAVSVLVALASAADAVPGSCFHWVQVFVGWAGYYPIFTWVWSC